MLKSGEACDRIWVVIRSENFNQVSRRLKDIPAQWAKIRQGLDIFRISLKFVCLSNGEI